MKNQAVRDQVIVLDDFTLLVAVVLWNRCVAAKRELVIATVGLVVLTAIELAEYRVAVRSHKAIGE